MEQPVAREGFAGTGAGTAARGTHRIAERPERANVAAARTNAITGLEVRYERPFHLPRQQGDLFKRDPIVKSHPANLPRQPGDVMRESDPTEGRYITKSFPNRGKA